MYKRCLPFGIWILDIIRLLVLGHWLLNLFQFLIIFHIEPHGEKEGL
jgi:hypothetical protein